MASTEHKETLEDDHSNQILHCASILKHENQTWETHAYSKQCQIAYAKQCSFMHVYVVTLHYVIESRPFFPTLRNAPVKRVCLSLWIVMDSFHARK